MSVSKHSAGMLKCAITALVHSVPLTTERYVFKNCENGDLFVVEEPKFNKNGKKNLHTLLNDKQTAIVLTSVQLAGVAQEVSLRITQARKHAKGIHPGFETQGKRHQKSKTRISVTL